MEGLVNVRTSFGGAFADKRVLLTGHTGFKGAWLSRWLLDLGAQVTGYALEPDTTPSLYSDLDLRALMDSRIGDIRDADRLSAVLTEVRPEVVFHLAAQPLVRRSYAEPKYTFETNVLGTVNLLEAVRASADCRVVVNVTTDKVYANPETGDAFDEACPLGGFDPYSASKAASELVTAAYRDSFFSAPDMAALATARAGNVIGGGDWAVDRLVPDCTRALLAGDPVVVRNPGSTRPWQHVLDPLSGYLRLGSVLLGDRSLAGAFNFGPDPAAVRSVGELADEFVSVWGSGSWSAPDTGVHPHEAAQLRLAIAKAGRELQWSPLWDFDTAVERTAAWYRAYCAGESASDLVEADLGAYEVAARVAGAAWA
ncbi:MAG: CDP-glucose 4 [Actinobacteria bacterium]|nr:MAG: CDP-glucose 4 [Actinomycetota bacterium]